MSLKKNPENEQPMLNESKHSEIFPSACTRIVTWCAFNVINIKVYNKTDSWPLFKYFYSTRVMEFSTPLPYNRALKGTTEAYLLLLKVQNIAQVVKPNNARLYYAIFQEKLWKSKHIFESDRETRDISRIFIAIYATGKSFR
jgi:hypothetical protein